MNKRLKLRLEIDNLGRDELAAILISNGYMFGLCPEAIPRSRRDILNYVRHILVDEALNAICKGLDEEQMHWENSQEDDDGEVVLDQAIRERVAKAFPELA
jgi:hypothetical protein